jgi:hypothetical protein
MKYLIAAISIGIGLLTLAIYLTPEASSAILFGWYSFLQRVLPRMTVFWPSIIVGAIALVLLAAGVHWLGASYVRYVTDRKEGASPRRWRFRWTFAIVSMVLVSFAAGISIIGAVHQIGWLSSTDEPLLGETVHSWHGDDSQNTMKMLFFGISYAEDVFDRYPPAAIVDASGTPLHGWEVHILPYLGGGYVTRDIDRTKPWNDVDNQSYFKCIVPDFVNPELRAPKLTDDEGYGLNHYSANGRVLKPTESMRPSAITDGESSTILLGEVNADFSPWGRPGNTRDPASGINRGNKGFGGPPSRNGAYFSMVDGSARFISNDIDPEVLKALSTPAAGDDAEAE